MGSNKEEEERQDEMQGEYRDKIAYWLFTDRIPVTKALIVANLVTFVAIYLFQQLATLSHFAYSSLTVRSEPWSLFTYPLVGFYCCNNTAVVSLLFACYWLWIAGGSLERGIGSARFASLFFLTSAITALGLWAGGSIVGGDTLAFALWLPLAGVTVAFAMKNPEEEVLFSFVLPLKLKYLAIISAAIVLISQAKAHPLIGVCALSGCAYAYWYVKGARFERFVRAPRENVTQVRPHRSLLSRLNPFSQLKARRDRERLRKLFEDSGLDDK